MRKLFFIIALLSLSLTSFAQNDNKKANELKLNLGTTVFGSYPEVTYERILMSDIALGASAGVGLDPKRYFHKYSFTPYVRWFFGGKSKSLEKYGSGFFIEANASAFQVKNWAYTIFGTDTDSNKPESKFGAGIGVVLGWKYLSSGNWVGEVHYGAGRDFVNKGIYPRMGISIGKRF